MVVYERIAEPPMGIPTVLSSSVTGTTYMYKTSNAASHMYCALHSNYTAVQVMTEGSHESEELYTKTLYVGWVTVYSLSSSSPLHQ